VYGVHRRNEEGGVARPGGERPRLNREAVLGEGVALADRSGLEGLSMRTLAERLSVVPMALYKHVTSKDDLLDGMIDAVWDEVRFPEQGAGWRTAMRERAISLREALRRHPWAIGGMESRRRPGPANLRAHNGMLGALREDGFPFRTAVHCTSALDAYIYGFALQERTLPFETPDESAAVAADTLAQQPDQSAAAAAYPHLIEVVMELAQSGYDPASEFLVGLDLLLDAIERLRPEWRSGGGRP
jgi:AcrR family transcriptional regulator